MHGMHESDEMTKKKLGVDESYHKNTYIFHKQHGELRYVLRKETRTYLHLLRWLIVVTFEIGSCFTAEVINTPVNVVSF